MKNKPIPLILLGISFLTMPLLSFAFNSVLSGTGIISYINLYFKSQNALEIIEFFVFPMTTGLLILLMRNWSYYLISPVVIWQIFMNFQVWSLDYSNNVYVLFAANGYLVFSLFYLWLPQVMQVFTNSRLQWWRSQTRFTTDIPHIIANNELLNDCSIKDLSQGGALVVGSAFPKDEKIRIGFSLGMYDFLKDAVVVHSQPGQMGVRFLGKDHLIMQAIRDGNLKPKVKPSNFKDDLKIWINEVKRGSGFIPEIKDL
jgi:hypothetical protein